MFLLRLLGRAFLLNRLFGRRRDSRRYGYGRGSRGRGGFFGPFPYYSRRTRGGSQVSVSGCCLPIPLGLMATLAAGARLLMRR
jgi:hypothetical protein